MTAVRPGSQRLTARLAVAEPYSYRRDPAVPPFPDDKALLIFDGVCVLCSAFARFVLTRDRDFGFYLTTAQSPLGQALFRHYGLDPLTLESNLLIADGLPYAKLDSVAETARRLGGIWRLGAPLLKLLPRPLADWSYDRVAQSRYALFGRTEACMIPPPEWRTHFID